MYNNDIKIKILIKNKNNLLANAIISVNTYSFGFITIKGFQVWISTTYNERLQAEINIKPLSQKNGFKYVDQVFIEERDKWYELERIIYDEYCKTRDKSNSEEVNIDDIPDDLSVTNQ